MTLHNHALRRHPHNDSRLRPAVFVTGARVRLGILLGLAALVCFTAGTASADSPKLNSGDASEVRSEAKAPSTGQALNWTANTSEAGSFRVGVWDVAWSPFDWLTAETYIWPWFVKMPSLAVKWRIWHSDEWAFSWKLGFMSLNVQNLNSDAAPASFKMIPSELAATWRFSPGWSLSLAGIYTPVILSGSYDANDLKGAAGYSNMQAALSLEWRFSDYWALWLRTRHLLGMDVSAKAEATTQVDPYTTITIHGDVGTQDIGGMGFPNTLSIVPGIAYYGPTFTFELGLGYGNLNAPGVNFMLPNKNVVPWLDLYWVF